MSLTSNDPNLGKVKIGNGSASAAVAQDIVEGSSVQISAVAESGASFQRWFDGNTNATRTVTVNEDMELQAIFVEDEPEDEEEYVTLTLNTNVDFADTPTGGGTFVKGKKHRSRFRYDPHRKLCEPV